jgi:hypothetical protein
MTLIVAQIFADDLRRFLAKEIHPVLICVNLSA